MTTASAVKGIEANPARTRPVRVAVIGGGQNCEHAVSLASAAAVVGALDPARYTAVPLTVGTAGDWYDGTGRLIGLGAAVDVLGTCAAVVPMLHGTRGEDGTIAALCDLARVPVVGSGVGAGALAMDKWVTKLVANACGIATAPGVLLNAASAVCYRFSHPVVVKPVSCGSSYGVGLAPSAEEFQRALVAAFQFDDRVLVEAVVRGREIDLAVLGRPDGSRVIAATLEIDVDGLFDLDTKYGGRARFKIPALLEPSDQRALEHAAIAMYDALGCAGVARIDFFLTEDGPVLNEVNTTPGFSELSQVPKMFAASGTSYPALLDMLIGDVLTSDVSTRSGGAARDSGLYT